MMPFLRRRNPAGVRTGHLVHAQPLGDAKAPPSIDERWEPHLVQAGRHLQAPLFRAPRRVRFAVTSPAEVPWNTPSRSIGHPTCTACAMAAMKIGVCAVQLIERRSRSDFSSAAGSAHPHIVRVAPIGRGAAFVALNFPRCVPPWSASLIELARPLWSNASTPGQSAIGARLAAGRCGRLPQQRGASDSPEPADARAANALLWTIVHTPSKDGGWLSLGRGCHVSYRTGEVEEG